ncbi:MAG: YdeI/OmpD-associated family protein [Burkholderiales bacterium]|nr:YdeI/OmpD-associated family protein [Burkholderiales bacterium]
MTGKAAAPALDVLSCESAAAWKPWLKKNHAASPGVWLRIATKGSGIDSITHPEALELALCHGWIDGLKKNDGEQHWLQKFTPRGARSIWSRINREKALALIESGAMQPAGLREVERAKEDGRWAAAYEPQSKAVVPPDLAAALAKSPKAKAFFAGLDSRNRYAVLFRVHGAKKPETRERRIAQFVEMLARGEKLHP